MSEPEAKAAGFETLIAKFPFGASGRAVAINEPEGFVRNFFGNIAIHDIEIRDVMGEKNIMLTIDEKDRGIAIGRDGERIKAAKSFLKKKFNATVHIRTRRSVI